MGDVVEFPAAGVPQSDSGGDGRPDVWIATMAFHRGSDGHTYGIIYGFNPDESVGGADAGDNLLKLAAILKSEAVRMLRVASEMAKRRAEKPNTDGKGGDDG